VKDGKPGNWPAELVYIPLMERLRCSYAEMMETPAWVIEDMLQVMRVEGRMNRGRR